MTTANRRRTPAHSIARHKAEIADLIAKLQNVVAAVPADGSWGNVGDLGHIEEELSDLVRAHQAKPPVLDQDQMTIWFRDERSRDKAKRAAAPKASRSVSVTTVLGNEKDDDEYGLQYGLQIQPAEGLAGSARDAALDDAIDLLMSTALDIKDCVIPGISE